MNKEQIKKQLDTFEDSVWVEKYGHDKHEVRKELNSENMHKSDMLEWIAEAVLLFNKILNGEKE